MQIGLNDAKSVSSAHPHVVKPTFSVLISPWHTPTACACCTAASSWYASHDFSSGDRNGRLAKRSVRENAKCCRMRYAASPRSDSMNRWYGMREGCRASVNDPARAASRSRAAATRRDSSGERSPRRRNTFTTTRSFSTTLEDVSPPLAGTCLPNTVFRNLPLPSDPAMRMSGQSLASSACRSGEGPPPPGDGVTHPWRQRGSTGWMGVKTSLHSIQRRLGPSAVRAAPAGVHTTTS